jgi:nucleotide-binding universal stress UspA family protein
MNDDPRTVAARRLAADGAGPRFVVAGFDGTDGASNALAYAAGLAERSHAHLLVVTVDRHSVAPGYPVSAPTHDGWVEQEVAAIIGAGRCNYEVLVLTGDPAMMLEAAAQGRHADVLVVGQPRHPFLHPFGSVPAQLARRADRPVLVVP